MSASVEVSAQQVIEAQKLVIDVFKGFRNELIEALGNIAHTSKSDNSPVTVYDVKVEEALKHRLSDEFPTWGFEGEETGISGSRELYWLVDPIDGTSSFIRGLPFSTNMAALVHNDEVIAAVVYDFTMDAMYTAIRGEGAFKNGVPIQLNTTRKQEGLLVYSLTAPKFGLIQEALKEIGIRAVLPLGASGHEYVQLAEGRIDGIVVLKKGTGQHDNAPGVLICEEAGAVMLPYDEEKGVYRSQFILGTPLVTELIEHSGLL